MESLASVGTTGWSEGGKVAPTDDINQLHSPVMIVLPVIYCVLNVSPQSSVQGEEK